MESQAAIDDMKAREGGPLSFEPLAFPDEPPSGGPSGERREAKKAPRKLGQLRADELLAKRLPPTRYIVPGLLAEGLTILAGRPKLGKSWLSLGLGVAVAAGGVALGSVEVEQGAVLYLALEDPERRLQSRLKQILRAEPPPRDLFIDTECPPLDEGGLEAIRDWLKTHTGARLVVIDVFNKVRPRALAREVPYEADYRALTPLKRLADQAGVAIVVVHHTRKVGAEDPFDTLSGSTGLTGVADAVLVLGRDSQGVTLYGRGRDIEEIETAMSFDHKTGQWTAKGAASEVRRSDQRTAILAALVEADEALSPADLAQALGISSNNVRQLLRKMVKDGQIHQSSPRQVRAPERTGDGERGR